MAAVSQRASRDRSQGSRPLTQQEMVLVAMGRAAEWTTRRLPYEDLVLRAWSDFPAEFSLRNHPEHPDASDIHKRIYQGLKPAGLVASLGNKVFRLTERGIAEARRLNAGIRGEAPRVKRLSRAEEDFVNRAVQSRPFHTFAAGHAGQLIDYDARMFFQFSTGTTVADRRLRVAFADAAIESAREIGVAEADQLAQLSALLQTRFPQLFEEVR